MLKQRSTYILGGPVPTDRCIRQLLAELSLSHSHINSPPVPQHSFVNSERGPTVSRSVPFSGSVHTSTTFSPYRGSDLVLGETESGCKITRYGPCAKRILGAVWKVPVHGQQVRAGGLEGTGRRVALRSRGRVLGRGQIWLRKLELSGFRMGLGHWLKMERNMALKFGV